MIIPADVLACAADVHPQTITKVIEVESTYNPNAININNGPRVKPRTKEEAIAIARKWIAKGYSVDVGFTQINSRNFMRWGYSVEQVIEPCTNLRLSARLLNDGYDRAKLIHGEGQAALKAALSAYNTGNLTKGLRNGYVAKYYKPSRATATTVSYTPNTTMNQAVIREDLTPQIYGNDTTIFVRPTRKPDSN